MRRVNYNYNAMKYFLNYLLLMFLLLCGGGSGGTRATSM